MKADFQQLGKCACGLQIYASKEQQRSISPVPLFGVAHDLPYCREFEEMEPDKFLAYVRLSRGIGEV